MLHNLRTRVRDWIWERTARSLLNYAVRPEYSARVVEVLARAIQPYAWRAPEYFRRWEEHGLHITPVYFYSPIPDTRTLSDTLWTRESELPGIDWNWSTQLDFISTIFPQFRSEYDRFPITGPSPDCDLYLKNPMFAGIDALALYCMVRHFRPAQILEVGSGFSSRFSARAALENDHGRLTCIEPFPDETLKKGFPGLTELIVCPVEQVPLASFEELEENDILFIDSSHVVRIGGDVNYLFLEVLPRLKPGVIVHLHDIFFPFPYRRDWVLEEFRFWNEQFLLQAFLAFNSRFEVLLCNQMLVHKHLSELKATFPQSPTWNGASFWMRVKPRTAFATSGTARSDKDIH